MLGLLEVLLQMALNFHVGASKIHAQTSVSTFQPRILNGLEYIHKFLIFVKQGRV